MDVSVCIVNYNAKKPLRNCINSIKKFAGNIKYEIIVVDNNSTDGSVEMIEKEFPDIQIIKNKKNLFLAKGYNQAIKIAKGKYMFFIDSDITIKAGKIESLVNFMEKNTKVGIGSGKIYFTNGKLHYNCWNRHTIKEEILNIEPIRRIVHSRQSIIYKQKMVDFDREEEKEVDVVCNGFTIVHKELIKKIGLYDKNFFLYYMEDDICHRLKKVGYKVYNIPHISGVHLLSYATKKLPFLIMLIIGTRDKIRYYNKYKGWFISMLIIYLSVIDCLTKIFIKIIKHLAKNAKIFCSHR